MEFTVRHYTEADHPFVETAWIRGARSEPPLCFMPRALYEDGMRRRVADHLEHASTLMLCLPDALDDRIGFVCFSRIVSSVVVHWIYVQNMYRRCGLATAVVASLGGAHVSTGISKHWRWIQRKGVAYDAFFAH